MNFEDERWVKLYTRDTTSWRMLTWQARTVLLHAFRKADRAGAIDLDNDGMDGLAVMLDLPIDVVEQGMHGKRGLLERGVVTLDLTGGGTFLLPRFLEAQAAISSGKARSQASRELAKATVERGLEPRGDMKTILRHTTSSGVSSEDALSSDATETGMPSQKKTLEDGGRRSDQNRSEQNREEQTNVVCGESPPPERAALVGRKAADLCLFSDDSAVGAKAESADRLSQAADRTADREVPATLAAPEPETFVLGHPGENRPMSPKDQVFAHWSAAITARNGGKGKAPIFDSKRKAKVEARLKEKYTVEDLCRAIDGCFATPFNRGDNANGKAYLDLELICRDASHVDGFIEAAPKAQQSPTGPEKSEPVEIYIPTDEERATFLSDLRALGAQPFDFQAPAPVEPTEKRKPSEAEVAAYEAKRAAALAKAKLAFPDEFGDV